MARSKRRGRKSAWQKHRKGKSARSARKSYRGKKSRNYGGLFGQIASLTKSFDSIAATRKKRRAAHTHRRAKSAMAMLHSSERAMKMLMKKYAAAGMRLKARSAAQAARRAARAKANLAAAMELASAGFLGTNSDKRIARLKLAVQRAEAQLSRVKSGGSKKSSSSGFPAGWDEHSGGYSGARSPTGATVADLLRDFDGDPRRGRRKKKSRKGKKRGSLRGRKKAWGKKRSSARGRKKSWGGKKRSATRGRKKSWGGKKRSTKRTTKRSAKGRKGMKGMANRMAGLRKYHSFVKSHMKKGKSHKAAVAAWKRSHKSGRDYDDFGGF